MKILILTLYYPPEPLKIFSDLAERLAAAGNEVTVVTAFPNWPSGKVHPGYRNRWPSIQTLNGVRVVRVPLIADHSRSSLKRAVSYLSFAFSVIVFTPWLVCRPDVIHTVPPPTTAVSARVLSRLWRIPFTYEVLDMWPETLRDTGMLTSTPALALVHRLCRWLYRRAAAVRVTSSGQHADLVAKGVPRDKLFLIPNWVDLKHYVPMDPDPELLRLCGGAGRFNVVYTGNLGVAQGLETVLAAGDELRGLSCVQFLIFGDGTDGAALRRRAAGMRLTNVQFMGSFPLESMARVCSIADCLLVHLRDRPAFRMAIPHKILGYLACGKPLVAAVAGDGAELVRRSRAGVVCAPDNAPALAGAIRRLLEMTPVELHALGRNGRRAARRFEVTAHVRRVETMLRCVVPAKNG